MFLFQQQKNLEGYVGFANLPNQVYRKSVKRGFEFTLMVVGEFVYFSLIETAFFLRLSVNHAVNLVLILYTSSKITLDPKQLRNRIFLIRACGRNCSFEVWAGMAKNAALPPFQHMQCVISSRASTGLPSEMH